MGCSGGWCGPSGNQGQSVQAGYRRSGGLANGKRKRCDIMDGITASKAMDMAGRTASEVPALQLIELDCADESLAQEMARWLTHLRAERRLSPKTLEAYARDLRQCLTFLSEHLGARVTLKGFAALE